MKKHLILFVILSWCINAYAQDLVYLQAKVPPHVKPGDEFTVEITIHKADLRCYASYKQSLPNGFSVIKDLSGQGVFKTKAHDLEYTWLRMPAKKSIVLKYIVKTEKDISGEFRLDGSFSYLVQNRKGEVALPIQKIMVVDEKSAKASKVKEIDRTNQEESSAQQLTCKRIINNRSSSNAQYEVKVTINKNKVAGVAKLTEELPDGFTVTPLSNAKASFFSNGRKAEFTWSELPTDAKFEISYLISPLKDVQTGNYSIKGQFVCFVDNRKKNIEVTGDKYLMVADNTAKTKQDVAQQGKTQAVRDLPNEQRISILAAQEARAKHEVNKASSEKKNTKSKNDTTKVKEAKKPDTKKLSSDKNSIIEGGQIYRLQFMDVFQPLPASYFRQYNFQKPINAEIIQNKYYYTVGPFHKRKDAENYKNNLAKNAKLTNVKIISYINGERK